jgi:arylsulfatase A-like enzyme
MKRVVTLGFALTALMLGYLLVNQVVPSHPSCPGCDVMVISLDQVRAKSLSCFGYSQATMPSLCAFAEKSKIFTEAYAPASRTQDSHFSMMTGLYPSSHTMNLPYASELPEGVVTLASLLKENGYRTHFMGPVNDPHLPLSRGMERGFVNTYDADDPERWIAAMETIQREATDSGQPSFYFMHTYLAHEPYMPKEENIARFYSGIIRPRISYDDLCALTYKKLLSLHPEIAGVEGREGSVCEKLFHYQANAKTRTEFDDVYSIIVDEYWQQFSDLSREEKAQYLHALYSASLYELDLALTDFFAYLEKNGYLQNTVIIIVGDQGDEFFEHNGYSHGGTLYNEVLKVPFLVYIPNAVGGTSSRLVSLVDIVPTISGITEIKIPRRISGLDVFGRIRHAYVLAEHVSDGVTAVISRRWKLIVSGSGEREPEYELYDLVSDAHEINNKAQTSQEIVRRILIRYEKLKKSLPRYPVIRRELPGWIRDEERKILIESGYF